MPKSKNHETAVLLYQAYCNDRVPLLAELVEIEDVLSDNSEAIIEQIVARYWRLA